MPVLIRNKRKRKTLSRRKRARRQKKFYLPLLLLIVAGAFLWFSQLAGHQKVSFYESRLFMKEPNAENIEEVPRLSRFTAEKIRVALNDSTLENLFHTEAVFSSGSTLLVKGLSSGKELNFPAGEEIRVEAGGGKLTVAGEGEGPVFFNEKIQLEPAQSSESEIVFHDLRRDGWIKESPAYYGIMQIEPRQESFLIVNELPLEKYLRRVVPSEMPASFEKKALKAQAVAARTYACRALVSGNYSSYGAHLDDSVSSQVYNNIKENPRVNRAIEETRGEVLFNHSQPVDARYFSTSWGYTANHEEVWSGREESFPGEEVPYLQAATQVPGKSVNFSSEKAVQEFLQKAPEEAYDYSSPYFRWKVRMTGEELRASLEHNLPGLYRRDPAFVLTYQEGEFVSRDIPPAPLGELKDIRPVSRGEGGNLKVVDLEGTAGTYRVKKEYNIRFLFRPVQYLEGHPPVELERHRAEERLNYELLPSAFAVFEKQRGEEGELLEVLIRGGGNGHGVGMSQYGADGMARQGYCYREILKHYYPGSRIEKLYK